MPLLQLSVIAIVQGFTEFLPISSSGHLVLVPIFTDWPDQGQTIDVAAHVGTLFAVMAYLYRDVWAMLVSVIMLIKGRITPGLRLIGFLIIGTLPVMAAGYAMNLYFPDGIRALEVIGWTTLGFGIVLLVADRIGLTLRRIDHLKTSDVVMIGFAQCLALVPGTSRSGICMTAGRLLGMERAESARFSMLLSMPAILGAGLLKGWSVYKAGELSLTGDLVVVAGLSFAAALVVIILLMAWLRRANFTPFAIYRVILGTGLLGLAYGGSNYF